MEIDFVLLIFLFFFFYFPFFSSFCFWENVRKEGEREKRNQAKIEQNSSQYSTFFVFLTATNCL